jgi:hypothetical protein
MVDTMYTDERPQFLERRTTAGQQQAVCRYGRETAAQRKQRTKRREIRLSDQLGHIDLACIGHRGQPESSRLARRHAEQRQPGLCGSRIKRIGRYEVAVGHVSADER